MTLMPVSVQAAPRDRSSWLALAARVEEAGFAGLYVFDHPGSGPAPFVALAAAAGVTERVQLGTCVVNAGRWEPLALAGEAATLHLVSGGRAILGVGAGHTPGEWTAIGRRYPSASERVDRMIELVETTSRLLAGERLSCAGRHFSLVDAAISEQPPFPDRVPLLVGGNGTRVLRFAARTADVVGVTGMGRTLDDGHRHEIDWSPAGLRRIANLVATQAETAGRSPHVEALVQHVEITDDPAAAAARLVEHVPGSSVEDLLHAPFVWLGPVEEIRSQLETYRRELGIDRYVVREPAIGEVCRIFGVANPAPVGTG